MLEEQSVDRERASSADAGLVLHIHLLAKQTVRLLLKRGQSVSFHAAPRCPSVTSR